MLVLPCGSLVSLAWVRGHGLGYVDMVSMTVVGVHSVRVRGRSFVCSAVKEGIKQNKKTIIIKQKALKSQF